MGIPNVMHTGRSGLIAAKTGVATAGHNISNANTEGFSRQKVDLKTAPPSEGFGPNAMIGRGVLVERVSRIHDNYLEKQVRNAGRDLSYFEEKDVAMTQLEDVFNEMNGDGLNRLVARFFNEFRQLANEPESEAVRQGVREATNAMANDFHRLRREVEDIRKHMDARVEGYVTEFNGLARQIKDMNIRIKALEVTGGSPNDLMDSRDVALKKLASLVDLQMHQDDGSSYVVDIRNVGPVIVGPQVEQLSVERTPDDGEGKPTNALTIRTSSSVASDVTHQLVGGKIGALLEVRDRVLSQALDRLDSLAFGVVTAVNEIHRQGYSMNGETGVDYFQHLEEPGRAAEFIGLSSKVQDNVNNMATALDPDSPADNRVAIAISRLQNMRLMNEGRVTMDDYYNSIVSEIGIVGGENKTALTQQKSILAQLNQIREQVSGVSIDEETTNLLQYQHSYDAAAKVIQVADEMLKTVLELRR